MDVDELDELLDDYDRELALKALYAISALIERARSERYARGWGYSHPCAAAEHLAEHGHALRAGCCALEVA